MNLQERISAFAKAGTFLSQFQPDGTEKRKDVTQNEPYFERMERAIKGAVHHNGWFTPDNVAFALKGWAELLTEENLNTWCAQYNIAEIDNEKTVAIIMAGNIPLVGFHDFLSVLISGYKVVAKLSSNDTQLLPLIAEYLQAVEPKFKNSIRFTENRLDGFDAVIATGSNNTARYFEYYFKNVPSIIRSNRNSVAVLTGEESEGQLAALGEDIFRYYGLGCRNVSKFFVPTDYDFDTFFKAIYNWSHIIDERKYANNYDYNKAIYLMSRFDLLENGFLMLKEDTNHASPIATLFYERYGSLDDLSKRVATDADKIQCVVSNGFTDDEITFGQTQRPGLMDYADGVDTMEFLIGPKNL